MTKESLQEQVNQWNQEHEAEEYKLVAFLEDNPQIRLDKRISKDGVNYREFMHMFNDILVKETNEFVDVLPKINEVYEEMQRLVAKRLLVNSGDHFTNNISIFDVSSRDALVNAVDFEWGCYASNGLPYVEPEPTCEFTEESIEQLPKSLQYNARQIFDNYLEYKKQWDRDESTRKLIPLAKEGNWVARLRLLIEHGKDLFDVSLSIEYPEIADKSKRSVINGSTWLIPRK